MVVKNFSVFNQSNRNFDFALRYEAEIEGKYWDQEAGLHFTKQF